MENHLTYRWTFTRGGITHIVAMPRSVGPFTACAEFDLSFYRNEAIASFKHGLATCVFCWAREIQEWEFESKKKGL